MTAPNVDPAAAARALAGTMGASSVPVRPRAGRGRLAQATKQVDPPNGEMRIGVVAAISSGRVRATVNNTTVPGDSTYITCLTSYANPQVGDTVVLYRQGSSWVALGALPGATVAGSPPTSAQSGWQVPTLLNGWANFGGGFMVAGYRRKSIGVHVRGLISGGTATAGTAIFTLPVGYRPATTQRSPIYAFGGGMNIVAEPPAADVGTDGQVKIIATTGATLLALNFIVDLD